MQPVSRSALLLRVPAVAWRRPEPVARLFFDALKGIVTMIRFERLFMSILLVSATSSLADGTPDEKSSPKQGVTPAERYKAVVKEFEHAKHERYLTAIGAKTEQEREELQKRPFEYGYFAEKMDRIARDVPGDPAALAPLVWVAVYTRGPMADRAIEAILQNHVRDPGIGSLAVQIGYIAPPGGDAILRAALAKNPNREARGHACLALAQKLKLEAEHAGSKEQATRLDNEAATLFERVVKEFSDIQSEHGPLGQIAKNGLFELQHLTVGKEAPEISGEDNEGRTMKLSDFRGKVVVLDFWGEWCGPCRSLYPFERVLIKRMEGKPFVFLGINSDPTDARDRVRSRMKQENNTWRYWIDGDWPGTIGASWNVQSWPTFYVIDAKGLIRHKAAGSADVAGVDAMVEKLVAELQGMADVRPLGPKVGERVVLRYGIALRNEDAGKGGARPAELPIGRDYQTARVYRVERTEGSELWLVSERIPEQGWANVGGVVRVGQAADYFSGQIRARPSAKAFNDRGMIWKDVGDDDKANADADEALRLDPTYAPAYRVRGNAQFGKRAYDRALAEYEEAVRLDPHSAPAHYSRGNAWLFKNDFGKALADYQESVRLDPEFPWGYNGIAWISATCPDPAQRNGKTAVEAAELTDRKDPFTLGTLAASLAEAGDFESAVKMDEKAAALITDERSRTESQARTELYRARKPYRLPDAP
jgi:thiol-disulfide isomerase/thioredoxin/Tfp pilus assembly protein PilF